MSKEKDFPHTVQDKKLPFLFHPDQGIVVLLLVQKNGNLRRSYILGTPPAEPVSIHPGRPRARPCSSPGVTTPPQVRDSGEPGTRNCHRMLDDKHLLDHPRMPPLPVASTPGSLQELRPVKTTPGIRESRTGPHLPIPSFHPEEARYGLRFPLFLASDPVPWEIMYTRMEKSSIYLYFQNIRLIFAPKKCSLFRFQRPSS